MKQLQRLRGLSLHTQATRRIGLHACCIIVGLATVASVSQIQAASTEAKVKTAYIYNLLRMATWPAEAFANEQSPYTIVILGEDKLEDLLDKVAESKQINKRSIVLKRISAIDGYVPCHVLYVTGTQTPEACKAILDKTANTSVLVLGETPGFGKQGATVNFFVDENGTTGYEMNLKAAAKHSLKFESQLQELATIVEK
jgi:hypothetical protein